MPNPRPPENMRVLVIPPSNDAEVYWATIPSHGQPANQLAALHKLVGGWIEAIPFDYPNHLTLLVDEEGNTRKRLPNPRASQVFGQPLVGTVVVTKEHRGNWVTLTEADKESVMARLSLAAE